MSTAKPHARRGAKAQRTRPGGPNRAGSPMRRGAAPPPRRQSGPRAPFHQHLIEHAEALVDEVLRFEAPADMTTSRYFKANPQLGLRDRGLIAEAVFAVLRRKLEYAQLAQSGTGPLSRRMVLLGLADTAGVEPIAGSLDATERTWLRRVATIDRGILAANTRLNLPEWLRVALAARFGDDELARIAEVLNRPAPLDLRVNTMTTTRDEALTMLRTAGVEAEATPLAPNGIRLAGKPALNAQRIFVEGRIEVQDEGSQLLASLVAPKRGEFIVDFCAGAGGKTLALGDLMRSTGRLYALDVSAKRLARLKPRLARSGLSNVHPVQIESERDAKLKRMAGKADRVLVDAPCSGLGTLRRNPDLKWRQSAEGVEEIRVKQAAILRAASTLVKRGGRLVYATCSLLNEENEQIIDAFLAEHPEFEPLSCAHLLEQQGIAIGSGERMRLWPHVHGTDGFFAAVFERRAK